MKRMYLLLLVCLFVLSGCHRDASSHLQQVIESNPISQMLHEKEAKEEEKEQAQKGLRVTLYGKEVSIPDYSGTPYVEINGNKPFFTSEEVINGYYESYSGLDDLGRCQVAMACLSLETKPMEGEKREEIGNVKPAGWQTAKYPGVVNGNYLYNRCHLIGWQLSAENANPLNLTTGTRYLNVDGMLPFENQVDAYLDKNLENHVMYRVTPVFLGDELVCRGILIEAQSYEDDGCVFCVYCYNVQPGIEINYLTGESRLSDDIPTIQPELVMEAQDYIINTKTGKIHKPSCSSVATISDENIEVYHGFLEDLTSKGYETCKKCKPE